MGQVLLMHAAKDPPEISQSRACALAAIAVNFAHAIAIVVARPLSGPAAWLPLPDRQMSQRKGRFYFGVASPLIRVQDAGCLLGSGSDHLQATRCVGPPLDKIADLPTLAPLDRKDRRAVCRISSVPASFVGTPTRRVLRIAMRSAFFPQRSGTTHRLRAHHPVKRPPRAFVADCAESAAGVYAHEADPVPIRGPAWQSVHLWQRHVPAAAVSRAVDVFRQRSSRSRACSSGHRLCTATPSTNHSAGRRGGSFHGNADIATRRDVTAALTSADKLARPAVRLSESQSCCESIADAQLKET